VLDFGVFLDFIPPTIVQVPGPLLQVLVKVRPATCFALFRRLERYAFSFQGPPTGRERMLAQREEPRGRACSSQSLLT
jgi:hypothetical protein